MEESIREGGGEKDRVGTPFCEPRESFPPRYALPQIWNVLGRCLDELANSLAPYGGIPCMAFPVTL